MAALAFFGSGAVTDAAHFETGSVTVEAGYFTGTAAFFVIAGTAAGVAALTVVGDSCATALVAVAVVTWAGLIAVVAVTEVAGYFSGAMTIHTLNDTCQIAAGAFAGVLADRASLYLLVIATRVLRRIVGVAWIVGITRIAVRWLRVIGVTLMVAGISLVRVAWMIRGIRITLIVRRGSIGITLIIRRRGIGIALIGIRLVAAIDDELDVRFYIRGGSDVELPFLGDFTY